jgi:hypothetical protein
VSTWDGDELSLVRTHYVQRAARALALAPACDRFAALCARHGARGLGGYQVLPREAAAIVKQLADRGIRCRRFPDGAAALIPALDELASGEVHAKLAAVLG